MHPNAIDLAEDKKARKKEQYAKYYAANRKKILKRKAPYLAEYKKKNKEKIAEQGAIYYKANKKNIAIKAAEYYKNNKEKVGAYRLKNKKQIAERRAMRRAGSTAFDIFSPQISWAEKTRRDPKNEKKLQVVCALCGNWFSPTVRQVEDRIQATIGKRRGDSNFYCSDNCKKACPVFNKTKYREGASPRQSVPRPGQKEWREKVIVCAEYACEMCGKIIENGEAHHIKPVAQHPLESMDIDNGLYLCKDCHKAVHSEIGCRPADLRCGA